MDRKTVTGMLIGVVLTVVIGASILTSTGPDVPIRFVSAASPSDYGVMTARTTTALTFRLTGHMES